MRTRNVRFLEGLGMASSNERKATAYVLEGLGYGGLKLRVRDIPAPPPGHVLVRMRAASLNFRDLKIIKGTYGRPPKLPLVPLSDGAGDVIEVGNGVGKFRPGSRIVPVYMQGWYTGPQTSDRIGWFSRGGDIDGTAIEYLVCHENDVVRIPDSMTYEHAACLPCAAVTAWHALVSVGRLQGGQNVLVLGSGGVSVFALQFARMHGAEVLATTRQESKVASLQQLGATQVINTGIFPDWETEVLRLTNGRGVDHVVEVGGEGTIGRSIRAVRPGGYIHVIGNLTGAFPSERTIAKGLTINSITVGSREMLAEVIRAFDKHRKAPLIDRTFQFSDLLDAFVYLEKGEHVGKVVVTF
jgi:NADPH:quinone reductase-like Zn-dependent oxidoreductase